MQKIIKFCAVLFFLASCFMVNAQEEKVKEKQKEKTALKKNIIKLNLSALLLKNISVQYERQTGKKSSFALNIHTIPFGQLPFQSTFKDIGGSSSSVQYSQFKLGSFGVIPEYRFYLSKGNLHGFYIGPFVSYSNYKMNLPVNYSNNSKTGIFNGNLDAFTGGLQFGAQFNFGKSVTLDWWIVGPNYGSGTGTLSLTAALSQSEQSDLSTQLKNIQDDAPLNTIKSYSVSSTGATVVAKGPWAGLRGLGFSLGIKF